MKGPIIMKNELPYELIALDLDGTLLNEKSRIPDSTTSLIQHLSSQGVQFTIATGRTFYSARLFANLLKIDLPLIACNGALIKKTLSEETILRHSIDDNILQKLINICEYHEIYYHGYSDSEIFLLRRTELTAKDGDTNLAPCHIVSSLLQLPPQTLLKLTVMGAVDKMDKIHQSFKENLSVSIIRIKPTHLEVFADGVSKGIALKLLSESLNILREKVLACGDGENDLEMLAFAGLGAGVANSNPLILKSADYISPYERSLGVEEIINKFVINKF